MRGLADGRFYEEIRLSLRMVSTPNNINDVVVKFIKINSRMEDFYGIFNRENRNYYRRRQSSFK